MVCKQKQYQDGNLMEVININTLINIRVYEVELPECSVEAFSANLIYENCFENLYSDGFTYHTLDNSTENSLKGNVTLIKFNSGKHQRKTTRGRELCCHWCNGKRHGYR